MLALSFIFYSRKDSVLTKDFEYNFKDLLRCQLCYSPNPLFHCDICKQHLCKTCIGEHLLDKSKEHKVVSFISKRAKCITKCLKHTSEYCDNYCMECDIPVCAHCISGFGHRDHKYIDMEEKLKMQKDILERDLQELENLIYPKYHEIASYIPVQKADLNENSKKLTATIEKHGEDLHREVENVIRKLKSNVYEINSKYLSVLNKQEGEITRTISEIKQSIAYIKGLLYSYKVSLVSGYKSRNSEFRIFPPKLTVSLPRFTPKKINEEQIYQQFGSLSEFSIEKEKRGLTVDFPRAEYSTTTDLYRPLIDEPRIITEINTGNDSGIHGVSCVTDEHIWTYGYIDNIMKLYNLQGELVESIQPKSGNRPLDIAVTRNGDLVYTDYDDKTVNIVKNTQIYTLIRLQGWSPHSVCSTSAGDLLVAMANNKSGETRIVRYSGLRYKQTIQFNDERTPLYSSGHYLKYISENKNLDICVSDYGARAVVVVDQAGKLRFIYLGPSGTPKGFFYPAGITTDSQSCILITDHDNNCIHIIDKDGQFLRYIDNCHLPWGICVDTRDNLFVTDSFTGRMKKIQYYI